MSGIIDIFQISISLLSSRRRPEAFILLERRPSPRRRCFSLAESLLLS